MCLLRIESGSGIPRVSDRPPNPLHHLIMFGTVAIHSIVLDWMYLGCLRQSISPGLCQVLCGLWLFSVCVEFCVGYVCAALQRKQMDSDVGGSARDNACWDRQVQLLPSRTFGVHVGQLSIYVWTHVSTVCGNHQIVCFKGWNVQISRQQFVRQCSGGSTLFLGWQYIVHMVL